MKTAKIKKFLGINNRLPDNSLATEDGYFLRDAVNVDVLLDGSLRRRKAAALHQAMTAPHSLKHGYLVRDSVLYKVTLPTYSEVLTKVLASNAAMSYAVDGDLYCTNGTDALRIASDGTAYTWGMATPDAPAVSQIAGTMFKGSYQVAVAYYNATTGEEGGISSSTMFTLTTDNAGLRITVPAASTGATHARIYVSTVNGSIPFFQKQVALGGTTDVTAHVTGREAPQRYELPMPAGSRVFFFNGRMCVVNGKTLFYGTPFRHGYYDPVEGRIDFQEDIATAIGNQDGVFITTATKTYYFAGFSLAEIEMVKNPLPYGAIKGTEFSHPRLAKVGWMSAHGLVIAGEGGQIETPMVSRIDVGTLPASGISAVFDDGDAVRVVSCGWCMNLETGAATRYTGYDFTSIDNGFATKSDGLYALNDAADVVASIDMGKHKFDGEELKRMPALYLGGEFYGAMRAVIETSRQGSFEYSARSYDSDLRIQRVDPGKGLKDNWYRIGLHNSNGFDFTLSSVSPATINSERRI